MLRLLLFIGLSSLVVLGKGTNRCRRSPYLIAASSDIVLSDEDFSTKCQQYRDGDETVANDLIASAWMAVWKFRNSITFGQNDDDLTGYFQDAIVKFLKKVREGTVPTYGLKAGYVVTMVRRLGANEWRDQRANAANSPRLIPLSDPRARSKADPGSDLHEETRKALELMKEQGAITAQEFDGLEWHLFGGLSLKDAEYVCGIKRQGLEATANRATQIIAQYLLLTAPEKFKDNDIPLTAHYRLAAFKLIYSQGRIQSALELLRPKLSATDYNVFQLLIDEPNLRQQDVAARVQIDVGNVSRSINRTIDKIHAFYRNPGSN